MESHLQGASQITNYMWHKQIKGQRQRGTNFDTCHLDIKLSHDERSKKWVTQDAVLHLFSTISI